MTTLSQYWSKRWKRLGKDGWTNIQTCQIPVISLGSGMTNLPKGVNGVVVALKGSTYTIRWLDKRGKMGMTEKFDISGGMAMDLRIRG